VSDRYLVTPKADEDLDEQAFYFASRANAALGHRFLVAAHETFLLLARQPGIGWVPKIRITELAAMRVVSVSGFPTILVLYTPTPDGIRILRVVHGSRDLQSWVPREGLND
jgi:toxin ParE1/3/4